MHELSIAMSLIEGVSQAAENNGAALVCSVRLRLGALSGVVKDALLFSYQLASEGTLAQGSQLIIENVPVTVFCDRCAAEKTLDSIQKFCCPTCSNMTPEILTGRELELVAIEVIDRNDEEPVEDNQLMGASL
jgi:hydrogenase nickel incorporation protein HypA/HybF